MDDFGIPMGFKLVKTTAWRSEMGRLAEGQGVNEHDIVGYVAEYKCWMPFHANFARVQYKRLGIADERIEGGEAGLIITCATIEGEMRNEQK